MQAPKSLLICALTARAQLDLLSDHLEELAEEGDRMLKRTKLGRNSPCPCGSGLKFKRCCHPEGSDCLPLPSGKISLHNKSYAASYKRYHRKHR